MKKKRDVAFKRIVRGSETNDRWVAELLIELDGKPNNDLAILQADLGPEFPMPLALSVQVVDSEHTWLVAINTHERETEFRDIYVQDRDITLGMTGYFERLWSVSVVVLDHGRITDKGHELLRRIST